jgi:hypothetical protein
MRCSREVDSEPHDPDGSDLWSHGIEIMPMAWVFICRTRSMGGPIGRLSRTQDVGLSLDNIA